MVYPNPAQKTVGIFSIPSIPAIPIAIGLPIGIKVPAISVIKKRPGYPYCNNLSKSIPKLEMLSDIVAPSGIKTQSRIRPITTITRPIKVRINIDLSNLLDCITLNIFNSLNLFKIIKP